VERGIPFQLRVESGETVFEFSSENAKFYCEKTILVARNRDGRGLIVPLDGGGGELKM